MPEGRPAQLVRTLTTAGGISVRTLIGSNLVAEAMMRKPMAPTAANALGRALMGAVLVAVGAGKATAEDTVGETLQLQLRGDGPLGSVVAIADAHGRVRGTVACPDTDQRHQDGSPDVARALGLGTHTVVRHRPSWREPYSGTVPLVSGEVARDLTLYLSESEQTPSAVGLGVAMTDDESAAVAAGFLIQTLPDADEAELAVIERNVAGLPPLSQLVLSGADAHELATLLVTGVGAREHHESAPVYFCPCTRARALRTLGLLERSELRTMIEAGEHQEVCCQFCGRAYDITPEEMVPLASDA